MATAEEFAQLTHFRRAEFRRPDAIHFPLLQFLDAVRERCGFALVPTSDARDYVPSGGSDGSLHLSGRAIDLRWIGDRHQRFALVDAVIRTPLPPGEGGVELGLEPGALGGPHIHLGLWPAGHPSSLFIR